MGRLYSSGKIWFGYGAAAQRGIGSVDPSTSPAAVTLNAASGFWYAAAATAGGELVAGEPGTYPTTNYPTSVSIAGDGTVAAGTCCGYQANGDGTNEIFMFAPGSSTPLNTISFGYVQLADDGAAALTPGWEPAVRRHAGQRTHAAHHRQPRTARARSHPVRP